MHEVFHEADHGPLELDKLQQISPEDYPCIRFQLHPAARLIASAYPIRRIWQVNQMDYLGDAYVDLSEGGEKLLIIRRRFVVETEPIGDGEFLMLAGFSHGLSFGDTLEQALAVVPQFDVGAFLQRRALDNTLVDLAALS